MNLDEIPDIEEPRPSPAGRNFLGVEYPQMRYRFFAMIPDLEESD